jgi:hypothetical protein
LKGFGIAIKFGKCDSIFLIFCSKDSLGNTNYLIAGLIGFRF